MPRHVILSQAIQCRAMPCRVVPCHVMMWTVPCQMMLRHIMLCHVLACQGMSCYAMICYVMWCCEVICYALACCILVCYVLIFHGVHAVSSYVMLSREASNSAIILRDNGFAKMLQLADALAHGHEPAPQKLQMVPEMVLPNGSPDRLFQMIFQIGSAVVFKDGSANWFSKLILRIGPCNWFSQFDSPNYFSHSILQIWLPPLVLTLVSLKLVVQCWNFPYWMPESRSSIWKIQIRHTITTFHMSNFEVDICYLRRFFNFQITSLNVPVSMSEHKVFNLKCWGSRMHFQSSN